MPSLHPSLRLGFGLAVCEGNSPSDELMKSGGRGEDGSEEELGRGKHTDRREWGTSLTSSLVVWFRATKKVWNPVNPTTDQRVKKQISTSRTVSSWLRIQNPMAQHPSSTDPAS